MTTKAVTPRVLDPPARPGQGLSVFPSAVAMVWPGPGHRHEAVAVPGVRLAPGDVLVQTELTTICGSDLDVVTGGRPVSAPLVLGHECVGRIVAFGRGGARSADGHRLEIGSRVVWSSRVPCGRCATCRRGRAGECEAALGYGRERMRRGWELSGACASHVHLLSGTPIVVVPESVPAVILAPAPCAAGRAVAVLDAASAIRPLEDSVLVIAGADLTGLTVCAMAVEAGSRVVVVDPSPRRRQSALAYGAHALVDPSAGEPAVRRIVLAAMRQSGRRVATGVVAVDLSGSVEAPRTLLALLGAGDGLVLGAGAYGPAGPLLDTERIAGNALTIRGVREYAPDQLVRAVGFLARSWERFPFEEGVAAAVALDVIDDAFDAMTREKASGDGLRVALAPQPSGATGHGLRVALASHSAGPTGDGLRLGPGPVL